MLSPIRRVVSMPVMVVALAAAAWISSGSPAFAKGGHGGGGHGGGGHGGGHHGGGHHGGGGHRGGHHGGYHSGGYHYGGHRYYHNHYYPYFYYGGSGYYSYPRYGYGYGSNFGYYSNGYYYPSYGYNDSTAAPAAVYPSPAQGRYLGIDEQPVVDNGVQGMQIVRVYAGSPAEQAGLQPGDVIYSANGYLTQQYRNIAWIIATVPPNGAIQMNVHSARDGATRTVSAQIP